MNKDSKIENVLLSKYEKYKYYCFRVTRLSNAED